MHIKFTLFNHFITTQNLVKHFNRRFFNLNKVIYVKKIFHVNSLNMDLSDYVKLVNILKAIKNATGTSAIFPINISLIHFVFVLTSVTNVGERFTKTCAQLHTSAKNFSKNDKFIKFFGYHIKS